MSVQYKGYFLSLGDEDWYTVTCNNVYVGQWPDYVAACQAIDKMSPCTSKVYYIGFLGALYISSLSVDGQFYNERSYSDIFEEFGGKESNLNVGEWAAYGNAIISGGIIVGSGGPTGVRIILRIPDDKIHTVALSSAGAGDKWTGQIPPSQLPSKMYRCTGPPNYACVEDPSGPYASLKSCLGSCVNPKPPPPKKNIAPVIAGVTIAVAIGAGTAYVILKRRRR